MNKRILVVFVLLAAATTTLMAYKFSQREEPFILSGSIEARDVDLGSLVGGRVKSIHVKESDLVKKGQVLIILDSDFIDLQILEQEGRIAEARANLARIQKGPRNEELARAQIEWENAERERQRLESLYKDGVIGRQQYDDSVTRAKTLEQSYRERRTGSRAEEIAAARAVLQREEGRLAFLRRQQEEAVIESTVDGVVESLELRPGDILQPNQSAVRILEPDQTWVRVYVPEPKLGFVRLNEKVAVRVDTFPSRIFEGRIVEISSKGEYTPRNVQTLDQRFDQVFGVKVSIPDSPELKPGMAATVELLTGEAQ